MYSIGKITIKVITKGAVLLLNQISTKRMMEMVGSTRMMTVMGENAFLKNSEMVDKKANSVASTNAITKLTSVRPSVLPRAR